MLIKHSFILYKKKVIETEGQSRNTSNIGHKAQDDDRKKKSKTKQKHEQHNKEN